ncbi:MAG TPA: methyltransferase domain-containing protein [Acidimicrobiales bacterium]|nr:methyltransferase domain-containing protein [Acidimicrobiales bacterium]
MTAAPPRPIGLAPGAPEEAAGQDERKYSTSNPVVRRLIGRWLERLRSHVPAGHGLLLDVGLGEGLALERLGLAGARPVVGVEYRFDKLVAARRRLPAAAGVRADAGMLPVATGRAEVVTCIEVLEHLVAPAAAVAELARACGAGGVCVVSVPWEPWFRLGNLGRGKNVRALGNDPEHVQQFSPARLAALLSTGFESVWVDRCFPWLIGLAVSPRRGSEPGPR